MTKEAQLVPGNERFHTWVRLAWVRIRLLVMFPNWFPGLPATFAGEPSPESSSQTRRGGSGSQQLCTHRSWFVQTSHAVKRHDGKACRRFDRQSESGYLCRCYDFLMVTLFKVCIPETGSLFSGENRSLQQYAMIPKGKKGNQYLRKFCYNMQHGPKELNRIVS